jgi:hypothetical protein
VESLTAQSLQRVRESRDARVELTIVRDSDRKRPLLAVIGAGPPSWRKRLSQVVDALVALDPYVAALAAELDNRDTSVHHIRPQGDLHEAPCDPKRHSSMVFKVL